MNKNRPPPMNKDNPNDEGDLFAIANAEYPLCSCTADAATCPFATEHRECDCWCHQKPRDSGAP